MTERRLALLFAPALPLAPLLLALAACGHERGEDGEARKDPPPPLGFELAMAGTAAGSEDALPAAQPAAGAVPVAPQDLWRRIESGTVRVIDVRTLEEVITGVIPEAEHIPLDRFDPAALDLSDGRKVVLYCRSGNRSEEAARLLAAVTGSPVEHLEGGVLAWEAAALPIDKPEFLED